MGERVEEILPRLFSEGIQLRPLGMSLVRSSEMNIRLKGGKHQGIWNLSIACIKIEQYRLSLCRVLIFLLAAQVD